MAAAARSVTWAGAPVVVAKLGWVGAFTDDKSPVSHAAKNAAAPTSRARVRDRATR